MYYTVMMCCNKCHAKPKCNAKTLNHIYCLSNECAGVSPVELSALRPGPHLLMIMHDKDECEYHRQLLISFDIENTPDNPHNNI